MDRDLVNVLWFVGWVVAVLLLFALGVRLPLQLRVSRWRALAYASSIVIAVVAIAMLADVALVRHDVHFDLTRERTFTPSAQARTVVRALTSEVRLTYFYQSQDPNGRRAKEVLEALGRQNSLLRVRTVDPDREPRLAERYGTRIYNVAVLEADGRRIQVLGTDEDDIALGILRVQRKQVKTICFIEGHGEYPFDNFEFHTHLETLQGHSHGGKAAGVVLTEGHGVGRLRRVLEGLGFEARKIVPAMLPDIPESCAAVIDANPRTTYLPHESDLLAAYLARGGAALLLYDLGFVVEPRLARLLAAVGVRVGQEVVIDPLDHYATDPETVAVPAYRSHPITDRMSLTFYPGVRPIDLLPAPPVVAVVPLFTSSKESYTQVTTPVESRDPSLRTVSPPSSGRVSRKPGPRVLAVAVEGTWPQGSTAGATFRLVVVGDADFASNSFIPYMANGDLAMSMVRWLVREERSPSIRPSLPVPALVVLTKRQMQGIFLVVEVVLPLSVVGWGAVVWRARR